MACGRHARAQVDVKADIALRRPLGHTRVEAHANEDRTAIERGLALDRRVHRVRGCGEGVEERVALRVHLDASVARERLPERPPVLRERAAVGVSQLAQQPRRALDVGEEEGDGAAWELEHGI